MDLVRTDRVRSADRDDLPGRIDRGDRTAADDARAVHQPQHHGPRTMPPQDVGPAVAVVIPLPDHLPRRIAVGDPDWQIVNTP